MMGFRIIISKDQYYYCKYRLVIIHSIKIK
jgi:hypothetical protein